MQATDENLNSDLTQVMEIYGGKYSHEELISMLKTGNIAQKQAAALQLDKIESIEDAQVLVSNLVGQDGKIREAVSFKLKELLPQHIEHFCSHKIYDVLLKAIIDINGNVCRNVICALEVFKQKPDFVQYFCPKLTEMTLELAQIKYQESSGKYEANKDLFKLYWCLEVVYALFESTPSEVIKEILTKTKEINEYTIREKTAKILTKTDDRDEWLQYKQGLGNDPNYYVRRFSIY